MPAMPRRTRQKFKSIAVVGNSLPRRCGIATFTTDLNEALASQASNANCSIVAMTDVPEGYRYPPTVRFEIPQNQLAEYRRAAEYLNTNHVDVVCLQHEYGIFGGRMGSHVLSLLDELRMPVVTTLHTVLKEPTPEQKEVLIELGGLSDRLIVMSRRAVDFLTDVYGIDPEKIRFVHHGIPDTPFVDPNYFKDLFGVEGKKVILTFGLLSPNKGIEHIINALPRIVERHPDTVYILLGATHPHVRKISGETYRLELQRLARRNGVDDHVVFHNRFVEIEELCEYLGAADIYVTPYLNEAQIVSGTLAYAMGAGKAIVSTPYWYAEEMLDEGRGRLVPFRDADAIADQVVDLLDNDTERHAIRKRAYTFTREAVWKDVGRQYIEVFAEAFEARMQRPTKPFMARTARKDSVDLTDLPDLKLKHLRRLTDDTGIYQHAKYTVPDRVHGYCTDDNARALIAAVLAHQLNPTDDSILDLSALYLGFMRHALNPQTGRFRNFMSFDRRWLEEMGSEDSHGRAIWGLGVAVGGLKDLGQIPLASNILHRALPAARDLESTRAIAFALVGIHAYLKRYSGDSEVRQVREDLAEKIFKRFQAHATDDWPWLEDNLTYANARLPHALLLSGQWMQRGEMTEMGFKTLEWLAGIHFQHGHFVAIGNRGWYPRGGEIARFDQQPIEAMTMIDACIEAYYVSREEKWVDRALETFNWFLGHNDFQVALYDDYSGGCRDGLQPDGANHNEGAESTLSWLMALATMRLFQAQRVLSAYPGAADEEPPMPAPEPGGLDVPSKAGDAARPAMNPTDDNEEQDTEAKE